MSKCNCQIEWGNDGDIKDEIAYCPLHSSAPELLEAAKEARTFMDKVAKLYKIEKTSNSGLDWDIRFKLDDAIRAAEKGGE